MHSHVLKSLSRVLALAMVAVVPVALAAQESAKPMPKSMEDSPSKWDIFAGYSYLAPKGTVSTPMGDGTVEPIGYHAILGGGILSVSRYFNKYVGVEGIGDVHLEKETTFPRDDFSGGSLGLIFRFPTSDITPFIHGLVGGERVGGPFFQTTTWGPVLTAGGGLDYATPLFDHHLAIRVFQADYQYVHEDYGPGIGGGRANPNIARLSAGIVYHIGTIAPPPPVTLSCAANPTSVFPGDPVTLTATTGGGDPKMTPVVTWSGVQGLSGTGTTATVATASLAPGSYTAKCTAKEGKPGKEGLKPWENAEGSATFTVKAFEPPTLSCSASPTTIKPGESSTITASGVSPQNRPLTYTYSAAAGTINGSGASASFSSTGAPTGPVSITCNVSDDKGQTATATTSVSIEAPPPPPQPHVQTLCSFNFTNDKARPTRVDNEAKACLDEVALDLQKQSDAKAVIVGDSNAKEKTPSKRKHAKQIDYAGQRAVNTKDYLVKEKGIDASRISVATGTADDQKVEDYLVPAGANFGADVSGTTPVDESTVTPQERKALGAKVHHHKKAATK